jgi:hypothetical protein
MPALEQCARSVGLGSRFRHRLRSRRHTGSMDVAGGAAWPLGGRPRNREQRTARPRMDTPHHNPGGSSKRADPQLSLRDVLAAVARARHTHLQLVCRDLHTDQVRARPAWDMALRIQLIEPVAIDADNGETLYRLSARGRRALRVLNLGRRRSGEE